MEWVLAWVIVWGIAAQLLARHLARSTDSVRWFFLGAILGPFGLLATLLGHPRCPRCSGRAYSGAIVCPHCNNAIPRCLSTEHVTSVKDVIAGKHIEKEVLWSELVEEDRSKELAGELVELLKEHPDGLNLLTNQAELLGDEWGIADVPEKRLERLHAVMAAMLYDGELKIDGEHYMLVWQD